MTSSTDIYNSSAAISVAGLTDYIQTLLEQDYQLQQIWIVGEVTDLRHHASGLFFTLQDPEAAAALRCVVWRSQISRLAAVPTEGTLMTLLGQVRLYPQRGSYQLMVWQSIPAGEGLNALRYRQLRDRLQLEGLFDEAQKRPLPAHPRTVGVVTSDQAAAWGDIQRTLKQRYPGLQVLLSPTLVQGTAAPAAIAQALERLCQDGRAEVIILARGGGAAEDLACFNNEQVVRAIALCSVPVVTGIGHERDQSLADLAADFAAHTPTAAATKAVPDLADLLAEHGDRQRFLIEAMQAQLAIGRARAEAAVYQLKRLRLDRQIEQIQQRQQWQQQRLRSAIRQRLQQAQGHSNALEQKLAALNPELALQRGYALVRQSSGQIVRTAAALSIGETVSIQLAQGTAKAQVTQVSARPQE
ncbi:MAG: exodeoxyribonuclease VII large subunit [Leptolyngbyaceae cyanobacterium SL_1_1]|nr:exodeoxyribonuclease VII large subunit [Leptolyngbyaceae cyanobacterium RM2_2_21]NJN02219.1 exodeoxyribonuclease VII large subunit [Leptolyngbyaceae cyanobacterium RM1_1_2]NJO09799.1 exodeoxyribonuclease VII large subunit [Leptolyngbyaceae cyanobacterium SL_1_1]